MTSMKNIIHIKGRFMTLKNSLISKAISKVVITAAVAVSLTSAAFAGQTLIKNVKVWDGTSNNLSKTQDVLI